MRYFEGFEIGGVNRVGSIVVSRDDIIDFASRFDPQPFHIDEEAARASVFGGLTASSCHTFALSALILHQSPDQIALVANLGAEVKFPTPLRPDDEIPLTKECIAKRVSKSRPGIGIVTTKTLLTNASEETVMDMTSSFMVRQQPQSTD